jgi:hypothetical protein
LTLLRSEIVRGLNSLLAALETSRVPAIVEGVYRDLARSPAETKTLEVVEAYQAFLLAYNTRFTGIERQVMHALDIAEFADSEWWTMVILASTPGQKGAEASSSIGRPLYRLRFVIDYLPSVVSLLAHRTDDLPGHARLLVVLPEEPGRRSSPARVVASLEAVTALYEALADLAGQPSSDLVLVSCDAGSDKLFEFAGLAPVIDAVRATLLEVWRNAIYYRDRRFDDRLDLIARGLPLLAELSAREEAGSIAKEQAELLKRKVLSGATKFIESGSSIPEMSELSLFVPREVLAPKEALLLEAG